MSYLQAVDEVRKAQPTVHINPGFEAQLALYQDMGCRLPGAREDEQAGVSEGTAVEERGPTNFRADATYRWFLFACGVKNGDQGYLQRVPLVSGGEHARRAVLLSSSGECSCRAGSGDRPALVRESRGGAAAAQTYRCRACRVPLFSESNVVDHRHPVVQAASDSVYASFSRHGGDGSSWLVARDTASAAGSASPAPPSSSSFSSSTFGARAPASKTPRGGKGASSRRVRRGGDEISGRVSTVGLASSADGDCCTSVFTEVLGWVQVSEVCRGVGQDPRQRFGKILCPGRKGGRGEVEMEAGAEAEAFCHSKLGSWSLDGAACSCGRMVKPALQFTLSRIERV